MNVYELVIALEKLGLGAEGKPVRIMVTSDNYEQADDQFYEVNGVESQPNAIYLELKLAFS